MTTQFDRLRDFLLHKMRMSQVYQPVMLKALLEKPEGATRRSIAEAFLSYDEAQKDYYEEIVKRYPWQTLRKHQLVERDGDRFKLAESFEGLTEEERSELIKLAEQQVQKFLSERKTDPFAHRRKNADALSGSLRYDVLARAKGRCEACGVPATERRLEVDHIVPRSKGGSNEFENLQSLCFQCNAQKRDRDDTPFRAWSKGASESHSDCPFCVPEDGQLVSEGAIHRIIRDKYPVTDGHHLIVPKRHVSDWFDLTPGEQNVLMSAVSDLRDVLLSKDNSIGGFNIGVNAGVDAGQTVAHAHVHLIPRRLGDVTDPIGGIRAVIPDRQRY